MSAAVAAPAAPGFKVRLLDGKTSLDSRDLIYFLSVIAFTLFATVVVIRRQRAG